MGNKVRPGMLMVGVMLIFAAAAIAQEQVPAPVYNEGDVWVFRVTQQQRIESTKTADGNFKMVYRGGKFIFVFPEGEKPQVKLDLSDIRRMVNEPNDMKQFLQFPLYVGQKWTTEYEAPVSAQPVRRKGETQITGIEQVATAAGTFRALKIERFETDITFKKKGGSHQATYTYYYSPEVRGIVKFAYDRAAGNGKNIELIKYVPAP